MIIVVGGRIAGGTTAALLAKHGEEVLLLERRKLPAPVVSMPIFWSDTLNVFAQIGFAEVLESYNFPRITYMSFEMLPGVRLSGRVPESRGRSWGYAIRREMLDYLLLNYVRTIPNIKVIEGFTVTDLLWQDRRVVGVRGNKGDGSIETIGAEIVIGADGTRSLVAKATNAQPYNIRASRTCFYYAYYCNVSPYTDQPAIVTYHGSHPFCYHAFTQEAEHGLTGVGVEAPATEFGRFKQDPEGTLVDCLSNIPDLRLRMGQAKRVTPVMGMLIPDMFYRKPYGLGWALVGDAGLFMDPITGQGFNDATESALWLCHAICQWRRGKSWEKALAGYQHTRDKSTKTNFDRAYEATDFHAQFPDWMQRWYAWMGTRPERSRAILCMLANVIPPERFFSRWRLSIAYLRHEILFRLSRGEKMHPFELWSFFRKT